MKNKPNSLSYLTAVSYFPVVNLLKLNWKFVQK